MKKHSVYILLGVGILLFSFIMGILLGPCLKNSKNDEPIIEEPQKEAIMLMIEFEGTEGLINFVNDLKERNIPGLLIVSAEFVENNCDVVNTLLGYHDIEIAGLDSSKALWDVPYEEQLTILQNSKEKIFECTGKEIRVFGSRYFAYDENTVKAAEQLGIEYVLARGTTGALATIYQPIEYDVKIFSVSNVDSQNWGTGSLCDYSYWAREGTASDFETELFGALKYDKISPVSHTYIGGLKKSWNDVYLKFFDESDLTWLDLDSFGKVDVSLSITEIPTNREVQYETPHPAVPLDEEANIENPCAVDDITESANTNTQTEDNGIVVFHNGTGIMCLEALSFLRTQGYEFTEYLNTDEDYSVKINEYKADFEKSEGMSETFSYYPIIFIKGRAFSGFNQTVQKNIEDLME